MPNITQIVNQLSFDELFFSNGNGHIKNMIITVYKDPVYQVSLNERLNAICLKAEKLTIDLNMPYFRLVVPKILDLQFSLVYYIEEGIDISTCMQMVTLESFGSTIPGVNFVSNKVFIKTQNAKAKVRNLTGKNNWGLTIDAMRKLLMHDLNGFVQEFLTEILYTRATESVNERIRLLMPNGYFAPLANVEGLQNIAFNAEVKEPFRVTEDKIVMALNGTTFDIRGIPRDNIMNSTKIVDIDTLNKNQTIQVYANDFFINTAANTFFGVSTIEALIVQREQYLSQ